MLDFVKISELMNSSSVSDQFVKQTKTLVYSKCDQLRSVLTQWKCLINYLNYTMFKKTCDYIFDDKLN